MNTNTIITIGSLAFAYMQQQELQDSFNSTIDDYKKELDSFKDQVNTNLIVMENNAKQREADNNNPANSATGTFIIDLAGIADTLWSSAASITIKDNSKNTLNIYAVILEWGICDKNGNVYTSDWLQWAYFGKEQSIVSPDKERTFYLNGTGHEKLYKIKSSRQAVRKIIKNGEKRFSKVKDKWYNAKGTMYIVTLSGDGDIVKVTDGTPVEGSVHYKGEGVVLRPSNKRTSYNGEYALRYYKNNGKGDAANRPK